MTNGQMWDYLVEHNIATEEELQLVTDVCGYNTEALCGVLYSRTGYNDFDQLEEEM